MANGHPKKETWPRSVGNLDRVRNEIFIKHGLKIHYKKISVDRVFGIFILSGEIEPGKSSCLPGGRSSQNIQMSREKNGRMSEWKNFWVAHIYISI